jgi:outer membrane protein assembly factor BamB
LAGAVIKRVVTRSPGTGLAPGTALPRRDVEKRIPPAVDAVAVPSITRRRLLGSLAAGTAALAGCTAPASFDADQRWPQAGFDAGNTAANPDAVGVPEEPRPAWVHTGGTYYRASTQVLVGDAVHANAGYGGLVALSPGDGSVRWRDDDGYKPLTPALAGGIVLPGRYGFRRVDADGGRAVLGTRFGYRDWQTDVDAYPQSPATVDGDLLFAGVGSPERPPGGRVVAVDATDGSTRWSTPVGTTVWGAPAVADGTVYVARRATRDPDRPAALLALAREDGTERWRVEVGGDDVADPVDAPATDGERVVVPTGGDLLALDPADGAELWRASFPGGVLASPALADGVVYAGGLDGRFRALDAGTGEERWASDAGPFRGGPAVGAARVYAASTDGTLTAWDRAGRRRWRVRVDAPVHGTPVVAGGRLFVATVEGLLYCLRAV